jgi:TfoX/Sxy family transcriptional regulator of competence genes
MQFKKSPPELVAAFERAVPQEADVERRKMFGYPAGFVDGNVFMSLYQDEFVLRLGAADRAALLAITGTRPFEPMPGRAMKAYVVVSPAILANAAALASWIAKALAHGRSLPAKSAKRPSAPRKSIVAPKGTVRVERATDSGSAHKKAKPRTTLAPARPRRRSGTIKKARRSS